jgi:hypothetical protein
MAKLTSKTIRPSASGYGIGMVATAPMLAQVDEQLAANGLDAQGSDTIVGTLSLTQDPNNLGTTPKITQTPLVEVNSPGAIVETVPGGGILSVGAVPQFSANRLRTVRFSFLEVCRSYPTIPGGDLQYGNAPKIYGGGIGIFGANTRGHSIWIFSIPKPHDGATINQIKAWFFLPSIPGALPNAMPTYSIAQIAAPTQAVTFLGVGSISTPATVAAYYNGGKPQSISLVTSPLAMNIQSNTYIVQLTDVDLSADDQAPVPIWTSIEVEYTLIGGEGFTQ